MTEIAFDIASLHAAYAARTLAPDGMVRLVLDRIEAAADPGIFISRFDEAALLSAVEALGPFDPVARPLWGVPCAIKDNIDVAGLPTTAACPDFAYRPERDAHVVARLRAAGAIVVGKTNLDQFATGLVGVRTPYPIPRNALDPALIPGGSSSGSAVATARGIVSFALGTDTAGSGRVPAGLNNIVGLKPSIGALSTSGVVPACRSLDCVSIFALTVDDAWQVLATAAEDDPGDDYARHFEYPCVLAAPAKRLRIGIPADPDIRQADDATRSGYEAACGVLADLGHELVPMPFADFVAAAGLLYDVGRAGWAAERYVATQAIFEASPDSLHPVTRSIIAGAGAVSAATTFKGFYDLQHLKRRIAPLLDQVDVMCVPTVQRYLTVAEVLADPIATNSMLGFNTNFVNLLDMCGISVPAARRADGWPTSVTILARAGQDALAAALARQVQEANGFALGATRWPLPPRAPAPPTTGARPQSIDLVVVGAHMRGMPLNRHLTALGARFVRTVSTAPDYRLYALGGQSVPKPGLVRVGTGRGAAIAAELWRVPLTNFGNLVADIAPPLGIGTLTLDDGSFAKGFIAEAIAAETAEDITRFGGWKAFLAAQSEVGEPLRAL